MKNILIISALFVSLILTTGCPIPFEDLAEVMLVSENDFSFSPQKEKYNVGDTLYVRLSFPRSVNYVYQDDKGKIILKNDYYNASLGYSLYKINTFSDTASVDAVDHKPDTLIPKIGYWGDYVTFIYDAQSEKYVNEFGFVLKEDGKFFFSNYYTKGSEFNIFINNILDGTDIETRESQSSALFYSTFENTGKGWFQFEVVE